MYNKIVFVILNCVFFCSCITKPSLPKEQERILGVIKKMMNQTILFSQEMKDNIEIDSLLKKDFKLVVYLDSAGCTECHLSLDEWSVTIREMKFLNEDVSFIFIVNNSSESVIRSLLSKHRFNYPVFIDKNDSFFKLNSLTNEHRFQVFLLDKKNNILLVGDPVRNDEIWKLYKTAVNRNNIDDSSLRNKNPKINEVITETIDLGEFDWNTAQSCTFTIQNNGEDLLVIQNISTSCGCTSVEYSKEPVQPGESLEMKVTYKADHAEHFNKTITVYCNAAVSPLQFKIVGNAK